MYADNCARCHGEQLEGEPNWQVRRASGRLPAPPHDDNGHTWHHPDKDLLEMTKYGMARFIGQNYESDMPAYAGVLSDKEIAAIFAYIRSEWSAKPRAYQARLNKRVR